MISFLEATKNLSFSLRLDFLVTREVYNLRISPQNVVRNKKWYV